MRQTHVAVSTQIELLSGHFTQAWTQQLKSTACVYIYIHFSQLVFYTFSHGQVFPIPSFAFSRIFNSVVPVTMKLNLGLRYSQDVSAFQNEVSRSKQSKARGIPKS